VMCPCLLADLALHNSYHFAAAIISASLEYCRERLFVKERTATDDLCRAGYIDHKTVAKEVGYCGSQQNHVLLDSVISRLRRMFVAEIALSCLGTGIG
jgi:hypothetical protein